MSTINNDYFVSVLAALPDDDTTLMAFLRETTAVLAGHYGNYEIVLVDGRGRLEFNDTIQAALREFEHVRCLRLSRRTDRLTAVNIGLGNVIGDSVVLISILDDRPDVIPAAVDQLRQRQATVFGCRTSRRDQGAVTRLGASVFYWYCRAVLNLRLPENATGFAVLGRRELNALLKIRDTHRRPELLSLYTGYPFVTMDYEPRADAESRKSVVARLRMAYDVTVASSLHPLRVVSLTALAMSFISLVFIAYAVGIYLFDPHYSQGWPSLSIQISAMFFFVFLILSIMSEYIGRMVSVTLDWPKTFIAEEKNSSVLAEDSRHNVV